MNQDNHDLQENTARLIRAAFGPEARPDPQTSREVLGRLVTQLRVGQTAVPFPERTLGLLAAALVLMAVWLASHMIGSTPAVTAAPAGPVIASVLFLNLAFVPAAAVLIVIRRRYA